MRQFDKHQLNSRTSVVVFNSSQQYHPPPKHHHFRCEYRSACHLSSQGRIGMWLTVLWTNSKQVDETSPPMVQSVDIYGRSLSTPQSAQRADQMFWLTFSQTNRRLLLRGAVQSASIEVFLPFNQVTSLTFNYFKSAFIGVKKWWDFFLNLDFYSNKQLFVLFYFNHFKKQNKTWCLRVYDVTWRAHTSSG